LKTELDRVQLSGAGLRFAIVVSRWHGGLTSKLADAAVKALEGSGADAASIETFRVPGAFELPLACLKAAESGKFDAVIALGVVIRGETPHFDYVAGQAAAGIMDAAMRTGIPVMFGVTTADTLAQAEARAGEGDDNKGHEAALSAIEMVAELRRLDRISSGDEKVFLNVV
jgi:6,7-dimethyl-8-ribityllumazine synthase